MTIAVLAGLGLWAWSKRKPEHALGYVPPPTRVQATPASAIIAAGASNPAAAVGLTIVAGAGAAVASNPADVVAGEALSQAVKNSQSLTTGLPTGVQIGDPGTMGIYVDASGYAHPTYIPTTEEAIQVAANIEAMQAVAWAGMPSVSIIAGSPTVKGNATNQIFPVTVKNLSNFSAQISCEVSSDYFDRGPGRAGPHIFAAGETYTFQCPVDFTGNTPGAGYQTTIPYHVILSYTKANGGEDQFAFADGVAIIVG